MTDLEFRIPNWTRFQHYKKQADDGRPKRRPAWIKVYTKLLDDPAYRGLSGPQRALLHDLWLWWARMGLGDDLVERWSGLDVELFNGLLSHSAKMSTWETLNHAGFIDIRASTSQGLKGAAARAEGEREGELRTNRSLDDLQVTRQQPVEVPGWTLPNPELPARDTTDDDIPF